MTKSREFATKVNLLVFFPCGASYILGAVHADRTRVIRTRLLRIVCIWICNLQENRATSTDAHEASKVDPIRAFTSECENFELLDTSISSDSSLPGSSNSN